MNAKNLVFVACVEVIITCMTTPLNYKRTKTERHDTN